MTAPSFARTVPLNKAPVQFQGCSRELYELVAGTTLTVSEVGALVLMETSGVLNKGLLEILEEGGKLEALDPPESRRPGTFPDKDLHVRFRQ